MRKPRRIQFSLLTLLLLAAAVAVWVGNWRLQHSIARLRGELPALRNLARELLVDDPDRFAVVAPHPTWYDQFRWNVYVPANTSVELKLQLREVDKRELGVPAESSPLKPGRHEIELLTDQGDDAWTIQILVDGETAISTNMPKHWNHGRGSRGGSAISKLLPNAELPIELFRRRFMVPTAPQQAEVPDGRCDGILLWIDQ